MKNTDELKTFTPIRYGSGNVASRGGGSTNTAGSLKETDGVPVMTPPIVAPGSPYGASTGINPNGDFYPATTGGKDALQTSIQVIDVDGTPLRGANITWGSASGTTTNENGEATIKVPSASTVVTISYMGKRTQVSKFADIQNALVTLQENVNNLPPVVVGNTPSTPAVSGDKKKSQMTAILIGVGAIFLVSALSSKGDKGSARKAVGLGKPKTKKKKHAKKSKAKKRKGLREPATIEI